MSSQRSSHEIEHGKKLAQHNAELTWGWGTPAGRLRAERRAQQIANAAELGPGKRVLEIGCGTGLFTEHFARTGAEIVAVDISGDLLAQARARGIPGSQVTFLERPFEECDINGPFDAVIGSSILHHLAIDQALAIIFELLKPGGRISFAEPNMLNPQILLQKNIPWIKERLGDSPDETAFVRWSLARWLKQIGFEQINVSPVDWLHPATPYVLIRPVRSIGRILEQMPVLREFSGSLSIVARRPI